ncbi:uncharacterized protein V1518DRAFT_423695 [Limtongia smithiae]|uniref:uncharacterized protein n=1 Tax=Limtongia smithiae TaxID=1125753 RepID=UPI0034CD6E5C
MSLVDELLADFSPSPEAVGTDKDVSREEDDGEGEKESDELQEQTSSRFLAHLRPLLEQMDKYSTTAPNSNFTSTVEDNPEYKLLVAVNDAAGEITDEIVLLHKSAAELYRPRFPELESLVLNPVDYARTALLIGNDVVGIREKQRALGEFLPAAIIMVLSVSSITATSRELGVAEISALQRVCETVLFLDEAKRRITQYVATKMQVFAPNTAALVGAQTAAQLFGAAGGLHGLATTPACNIASLGVKRNQTNIGLGKTGVRQQGFLYASSAVQRTPPDLRRQALRILAGKVALATRIDVAREHSDGNAGHKMREEVESKLVKLGVAPANAGPKALPAPDDRPSKKRGGKRVRRYKQQFAMTDLRRAQNRMRFSAQDGDYIRGEDDDDD